MTKQELNDATPPSSTTGEPNTAQRMTNESMGSEPAPNGRRPLIDVERLSVGFDDAWILRDISLQIRRGETVAIIGESGCGKTVLMKTLVGLIRPTRGRVRFDGIDLGGGETSTASRGGPSTDVRRRIGFVFQNAALFDSLTVFENVAFPLVQNQTPRLEIQGIVAERLTDVGIPDGAHDKFPMQLSGGMRKRVGVARALAMGPELMVYDEPTTGLDPIMSDVINELMLAVRRRHPVTSIIVTHDMHTARKVADRVIMLYPRTRLDADESQVLYDGPPSGLDNAPERRVRQFVRGDASERLAELVADRG